MLRLWLFVEKGRVELSLICGGIEASQALGRAGRGAVQEGARACPQLVEMINHRLRREAVERGGVA